MSWELSHQVISLFQQGLEWRRNGETGEGQEMAASAAIIDFEIH